MNQQQRLKALDDANKIIVKVGEDAGKSNLNDAQVVGLDAAFDDIMESVESAQDRYGEAEEDDQLEGVLESEDE